MKYILLFFMLTFIFNSLHADDKVKKENKQMVEEPEWVDAMKAVHAKGGGQKGSVSQIGDSITYSKAFLAGMTWGELKGPEWKILTEKVDLKLFNERKGPVNGNMSGWTAADGLIKIKEVLDYHKPEIAVIMFGTNDVAKSVTLREFEKNLQGILDACLASGCIPIISTIPPILNKEDKVKEVNDLLKTIAKEKSIPLIDFYAAILERQPGVLWNGTLLNKGDVHPTGGKNFDFSKENLKVCGYALRNYVTCKVLQEVIVKCFEEKPKE